MDNQPVLSLCIPTNGAVEWVLPVIESIYAQGYDNEKFEVVITDNGKDSQLPEYITKLNYPNLRYKQTQDEGFLNLVSCLKKGRGLFCKMINHRSVLVGDSIEKMVDLVNRYKDTRPIIYCASGEIRKPEIVECRNLNDFVLNLSYWCSWSAGIGFWREDIPVIDTIALNKMFPNTSLLFEIRQESEYVIWNYPYQKMQDDSGKGGYDLFHTFGVDFLDLLNEQRIRGRITNDTFERVKKDLLSFLNALYISEVALPTKHAFIIENVQRSMAVHYCKADYYAMVLKAWLKARVINLKRKK